MDILFFGTDGFLQETPCLTRSFLHDSCAFPRSYRQARSQHPITLMHLFLDFLLSVEHPPSFCQVVACLEKFRGGRPFMSPLHLLRNICGTFDKRHHLRHSDVVHPWPLSSKGPPPSSVPYRPSNKRKYWVSVNPDRKPTESDHLNQRKGFVWQVSGGVRGCCGSHCLG